MTPYIETAQAFLAIGGRIMVDETAAGHLTSGLDAKVLFSLDLSDDEAARRMAIVRAFDASSEENPAAFRVLVREHGHRKGDRWIVWESPRAEWDRAMGIYTRARSYSDRLPENDPAEDRAIDAYCEAMDRVIVTPAPDCLALATKIDLIVERDCHVVDWLTSLAADARRLHTEGF